ncbi:MAG: T9SS type A sorting domain-containing protein [candidate division Zixibacteria bacterium]|nr:T9SS type A sorting domain-containing protein [candidate division Zixibacteria bacterium]
MKGKLLFLTVVIGCLFIGNNLKAIELQPTDDMYIDTLTTVPHSPDELIVANEPVEPHVNQILMKFDISPYMGEQIDDAILHLYRFYGCGQGNTVANFYEVTEEWDEDTWPEDTYISHDNNSWCRYTFNIMGWNNIYLTDIIQFWLDGNMENRGFVIEGESGTRLSKIYSKEAPDFNPYLELLGITSINEAEVVPLDFDFNIYPNPFNAFASINYSLAKTSNISVEVYDILGKKVETLASTIQPAGSYQINWNANEHPSGVYFCRLSIDDNSSVKKVVLLK